MQNNIFSSAQASIKDEASTAIVSGFTPTPQTPDPTAAAISGLGAIAKEVGKSRDATKRSDLSKDLSEVDQNLQSDISSYEDSKQDLANIVQQQRTSADLTREDKDVLGSLQKNFENATTARRNKLINSGDLDTRLSAKVKAFISDNPHLASDARSLLAGYKGTGSLPPEIKGVLRAREETAFKMASIGLNSDDPVVTANYLAGEKAKRDAKISALRASTAINNAKYISEDVIGVAMESMNDQFNALFSEWKIAAPKDEKTMLAGLDAFEANIIRNVNLNMSDRERKSQERGELLRFDSQEGDRVRSAISGYIDIYRSVIKNHGAQPLHALEKMVGIIKNRAQLAAPELTALRVVVGDSTFDRMVGKWDEVYGFTGPQYLDYRRDLPPSQRVASDFLRQIGPDKAISNIIQGIGKGYSSLELSSLYGKGLVKHTASRNISLSNDMYKSGKLDDKTRSFASNSLQVLLNTGDSSLDVAAWDKMLAASPSEKQMLLKDPKMNSELKSEFASFRKRSLVDASRELVAIDNIKINTKTGRLELIQSDWAKMTGPKGERDSDSNPYSSRFQLADDARTVELLNDYIALGDHPDFDKVADVPSLHLAADALTELQRANKFAQSAKEVTKEE